MRIFGIGNRSLRFVIKIDLRLLLVDSKAKIFVAAFKLQLLAPGLHHGRSGDMAIRQQICSTCTNGVKIPRPITHLLVTKTNQNQIKVQINNYDFNGIHLISKATIKIR